MGLIVGKLLVATLADSGFGKIPDEFLEVYVVGLDVGLHLSDLGLFFLVVGEEEVLLALEVLEAEVHVEDTIPLLLVLRTRKFEVQVFVGLRLVLNERDHHEDERLLIVLYVVDFKQTDVPEEAAALLVFEDLEFALDEHDQYVHELQ